MSPDSEGNTPGDESASIPPRYVVRLRFFCSQGFCQVPAVWRVDYSDGSFLAVCEAHYRMLIRTFPAVEGRSRLFLDGEYVEPGFGAIRILHKSPDGFTVWRVVGASPKIDPPPGDRYIQERFA